MLLTKSLLTDHAAVTDLAVESLNISGRLRFRATGLSMMPAISPGSCVTIKKTDIAAVEPGSVVLVRSHAGLLLHRLVGRDGQFAITRGDNNKDPDPPVTCAQILGVMAAVERPRILRRWYFRVRAQIRTWQHGR